MVDTLSPNPQPPTDRIAKARHFLEDYAWFLVRNVVGWILILASPVLGAFFPGPGGLPIFLIGFALVTFPGKRKLTARVLRGRRIHIEDWYFSLAAAFVSIIIPGIVLWIVWAEYEEPIRVLIAEYAPKPIVFVSMALLAVALTWLVTRVSLKCLNGLLRLLPRFRRKFRPWLKRRGLMLLPPRRRRAPELPLPPDEILEISPQYQKRMKRFWQVTQPWIRRAVFIGITVWIIAVMIRPLHRNWHAVREQIAALNVGQFLLASGLFAGFLLCFRALSWRRIVKAFGYKLPYGAAVRIWSTSELARYLPGAIWQVVGRWMLAKPYGIPKEVTITSQILEICIFLFANVIVAGTCLLYFGQKFDAHARPWFVTALVLVPTLALLLHPKIFYGAANRILGWIGKPPIVKRLRGRKLVQLLFWMILGLIGQSLCVYLIVKPALPGFKPDWWWVMAGAYCLAWCAGFLAFWAPGGLGVRELVFVHAMRAIMPDQVKHHFNDPGTLKALLVLLGFLLRLWTIIGELLLTCVAYIWDFRGAINDPNAPGRVKEHPPEDDESPTPPQTPTDLRRVAQGLGR